MTDWHTKKEKELIDRFGGTHTKSYGADGERNGRPLEVRVAKNEDRFRLNRDTHQELVDEGGAYIFDDVEDNKPPRAVSAGRVDDLLGDPDGADDWHSDRGYEHQFLSVSSVFDL